MRKAEIEKLKGRVLLFEEENHRLRLALEVIAERHGIKEAKWALEKPSVAQKIVEMDQTFEKPRKGKGKYRTG